jgi:hypothetical protein
MKKTIVLICGILLSFALFSQQKSFIQESQVVNIEVPVQVFNKGKFVENLEIRDFEVFEDGIPQKVE